MCLLYPELTRTRSQVALPLRSRGRVLGALSLHSDQIDAFDPDLVIVLQVMADQVASRITDMLTALRKERKSIFF